MKKNCDFVNVVHSASLVRHKRQQEMAIVLRCIIYILTEAEDDHLIIRDKVTKHMLEIGTKLKEYLNCSPNEYLNKTDMNKDLFGHQMLR